MGNIFEEENDGNLGNLDNLGSSVVVENILDGDDLERVIVRLQKEYSDAQSETVKAKEKWDKYRRQRKGQPQYESKNFPFPNSSNVSVPLTRMLTNTLYGILKEAILGRDPMWTVESFLDDPEQKAISKTLTKYMDILAKSPSDLDIAKKASTVFIEGGLLGFQWRKVIWSTIERKVRIDLDDGTVGDTTLKVHDGPEVVLCPPEDVMYKRGWGKLEHIPVMFFDVHLPWHIIVERAEQGIYDMDAVEMMKSKSTDSQPKNVIDREAREGIELGREEEWDLTEAHFFEDVDGDGVMEQLVFVIHIESGIVLRQGYNEMGFPQLKAFVFLDEPWRIEGSGIGQACENMQDEVDAIHNMRNDNMKVANMRMWAVKRGGDVKMNEQIYPGKVFFLSNPQTDIQSLQAGEVYPSSLSAEDYTVMYSHKATGIPSDMAGFPNQQLGSRDTARGQNQRLGQSQGIMSAMIDNMQEGFSELGKDIFYMLVKHRDRVIENEQTRGRLTQEEIIHLEKALNIKYEDIPFKLSFKITTSDIEQSFEIKRQNMLTLTQLYTQWANQTMPLAFQLYGPQGKQMQQESPDLYKYMLEILVGSTNMLKEIFKFFGEDQTEEYLPDMRKSEMLRDFLNQMQSMALQQITGGMNAIKSQGRGGEEVSGGPSFGGPGPEGREPGIELG